MGNPLATRSGLPPRRCWAATVAAPAQQPAAPAPATIKIGIVTFLTGPAAAPFGIPEDDAAEILVENLNAGKVPAPYNQVGFGGAKLEVKFIDEAGSTAQQVTEYRNLVQRDKVDVVLGYVSSGNCLAIVPLAEELQQRPCSTFAAHRASTRRSRANTCSASIRTPPWTTWRRRNTRSTRTRTSRSIRASTRTTPGGRIPGATSIWR